MKECTETDKPLVSIVMATYNPRMDWLREQLISLENQSYENLELLILDDCSSEVPFNEIEDCVNRCITRIPYEIHQNEQNLGSTKTFEKLTLLAKGKCIAYCDQDDIWDRDKIKTLLDFLNNDNINLAYSEVTIIDETGRAIADNITEYRKRHILFEGENLVEKLLLRNFVTGCAMLIKAETAKKSIPFIENMVHDHYLALSASLTGGLALCRKALVSYRIHDTNQTNTLAKVKNKEDYYVYKIKAYNNQLRQLENRFAGINFTDISNIKKWANARDLYYRGNWKSAGMIWKYRNFDLSISLFELIMLKMPSPLFLFVLKKIKEGKI